MGGAGYTKGVSASADSHLCSEEADDTDAARGQPSSGELLHQLQHSLGLCPVAGAAAALAVLLAAAHLQEADRRQARQQGRPLLGCAAVDQLAVVEEPVGHAADCWVAPASYPCMASSYFIILDFIIYYILYFMIYYILYFIILY